MRHFSVNFKTGFRRYVRARNFLIANCTCVALVKVGSLVGLSKNIFKNNEELKRDKESKKREEGTNST